MKFLTFKGKSEAKQEAGKVIMLSKFYKPKYEAFYKHATELKEDNLQQKITIYEVHIEDGLIKHIKREGIFIVKELRKANNGVEAILNDAEGKETALNAEYFYFRQTRKR
ncbi:MAG: hypothetical protein V1886_02265 [archaeon]